MNENTMNNPKSKVITGPLHADNKGASDWGPQGFIAYGCHRYIVVVDPKTLQVIQTLGPHTSTVTHVKWAREKYHHAFATGRTYSLILAAADSSGNILIWDVVTGNIRTEFQRPHVHIRFLEMEWYPGHDESHDLLVVLRYPGQLEMWDAYPGVQLWKKEFGENILSFALDPFDINNLIGLCEVTHLVMVSDLNPTKEPQSDKLKYLWYSDPNPVINNQGSLKRQNSGEKSPSRTSSSSWSKMATLATSMILPESKSKRWSINEEQDTLSSCLQMVYSPVHDHVVLMVFSTEIQYIDVDVELLIGTIRIDKASPFIMKVIPCQTADMLYCLNDNGSISVRIRKQKNPKGVTEEALDMNYETCCLSDSMRLLRHVKIVGFLHHPMREKQVSIQLSDSKMIILDVMERTFNKDDSSMEPNITLGDMVNGLSVFLPGKLTDKQASDDGDEGEITLRMAVSGLISGLNFPVTCVCMRPSRASRHEVGQHIAVGSGCGAIQLVNVYTGQVEHEYKLFSNPVRGMEWMRSWEIIAYTYSEPTNYGNRGVKNEVIVLNTVTGKVTVIRKPLDNEGPIQILKASPSCKFVVLAVKDKPLEIWNIRTKMLIKTLTDIQQKPNYIAWHTSVVTVIDEDNKKSVVEQCFIAVPYEDISLLRFQISDGIVRKLIAFTNDNVFGQSSARPDIVTMVWKDLKFILADKAGQLFLKHSNSTTPTARKFHDKPGQVAKQIHFAPGKNNYKFLVMYQQSIDVWEIVDYKVEYVTSSPSLNSLFLDATWTGPESVAIVTEDFCLHVMNLTGRSPVSPDKQDDFVHVHERVIKTFSTPMQNWKTTEVFSPAMLDRKTSFLLKYSLQCDIEPFNTDVQTLLQLIDSDIKSAIEDTNKTADRCLHIARLFGDEHDVEFWQLFRYMSKFGHVDETALGTLEKPFNLSEWTSKLLSPSSEVNDLLDLSISNLDTKSPSNDLDERSLDSSWVNAFVRERELFIPSPFGLLMDHEDYKRYEASRLLLDNKRADSYRVKKICASRFIMLNKIVMATQTLMETDTDNPDFRHDCLKACLTSCVQPTSESLGTLKLAATHLIAAGHLQDGVDLLCLINKEADACKYMISYGKWLPAVWLAKIGLEGTERIGVLFKYVDFLWQNSQKMKAVLVMMSLGQYMTVLRMLLDLGQYDTAALFLQACIENSLLSNLNGIDAVYLEFSKFLIVTQYQSAIQHYCEKAGGQGYSLLQELQSMKKV